VHKCVGIDRRLNPGRIASVLKEINACIIALQEVLCIQGRNSEDDQAHFIARELGFNYCMGHNRAALLASDHLPIFADFRVR